MNKITKEKILPLSLSLAVVLLDQITKCIVVKNIPRLSIFSDDAVIEVFGKYLRLVHVRNNAIAFSMGSGLSDTLRGFLFALLPLLVVIAVYVIYFRNNEFTKIQRWAICGVLGGGIGNLIDRFFRPEGVVDFIDCYFFGLFGMERWPTFNIADSAVVVFGAVFFVAFLLQSKSGGGKE
ncbi:signal peptidase II [Treponema sp.]|uniref:signal peptidase II n=1 Tax=Treponema sp. TaxID=166 RepID=UPI003F0D20F0